MASANSRHETNRVGSSSQTFPLRDLHHNPVPTAPSGSPAFDSYAAYLKSILDYGPEYSSLIEYLESNDSAADSHSSIMVAEVHSDKISCKTFEFSYDMNAALASILSTSEQDSVTTQAQIILIQSYLGKGIQKLVDAIGLLYDVDPAFFQMIPLSYKRDFEDTEKASRSFPPVFSMSSLFNKRVFETAEIVPRPPPPRQFLSISGKLVCQILQGRNVAGHEYSVGKLASPIIRHCTTNKDSAWLRKLKDINRQRTYVRSSHGQPSQYPSFSSVFSSSPEKSQKL